MRRGFDGYISATGMFKATFPYADVADEEAERKYFQSLPKTSLDEATGHVWVPEEQALELATDYNITLWIQALLDATPICRARLAPVVSAPPKLQPPRPPLDAPTPSRTSRLRRSVNDVNSNAA